MPPALLLLLLLLLVAAPPPGEPSEAQPRSPLLGDLDWLLLVSGNEQGWHEPCGCAAVRAGGIARRGGLDARLAEVDPDRPRVWALAGNFAATGDGEPGWARTEALLDWAASAPAAAVNLGGRELEAGLDRILDLAEARGLALVSSSLVRAEEPDREWLEEPVAFHQVPGGPRVAFVGLTTHRPGERFDSGAARTRPPAQALEAGLRAARAGGAQRVVVLAALPVEEVEELAASAAGAQAWFVGAVGGHQLQGSGWAFLGARGRVVLEAGFGAGEPVLRYHVLDQRRPEEPELAQRQLAASLRVNELRREEARERLPAAPAAGSPLAGSESCRSCHVPEYLAWERFGHSRALDTLAASAADFDPDCLACHATGFARPGGFRSPLETPELAQVGCESCHGAAAAHVRSGGTEPLGPVPVGTCTACHDEANSPGFDRGEAWRRIRHGAASP